MAHHVYGITNGVLSGSLRQYCFDAEYITSTLRDRYIKRIVYDFNGIVDDFRNTNILTPKFANDFEIYK